MHKRLQFSAVTISHSLSTVFEGRAYDRLDQRRVFAEFEANGEKLCHKARGASKKRVFDE